MNEYNKFDAALYDDFYSMGVDGDVEFYVEKSKSAQGKVLEIGCGTGRILIAVAEAGVDIVGIDKSNEMLAIARKKISSLSRSTQEKIEIIEGDMKQFSLGQQFNLIIIPFRAFMHMLTVEDQKSCLENIYNHLSPQGQLIFNVFNPLITAISAHVTPLGYALKKDSEFIRSETGNKVVSWESQQYDVAQQILETTYLFDELNKRGEVIQRTYSSLKLRYSFRYEMQHLLEICGFEGIHLYKDFELHPFDLGYEQVWIAKKGN